MEFKKEERVKIIVYLYTCTKKRKKKGNRTKELEPIEKKEYCGVKKPYLVFDVR